MDVLQLDISGRPQAWISAREAAILYASDAIAWTLGDTFHVLRGGTQRVSGKQSRPSTGMRCPGHITRASAAFHVVPAKRNITTTMVHG